MINSLRKIVAIVVLFYCVFNLNAQEKDKNQLEKLSQYIGTWHSTNSLKDSVLNNQSTIKMVVKPLLNNNNALSVAVFQKKNKSWKTILVELISFDSITNEIIAKGVNDKNECFIGKGFFYNTNEWIMEDKNLNGDFISKITFNFVNQTEIILKATNANNNLLWEIKYIKQNPKDKNIGIQLVSVRDLMQKDAKGTLKQLSRIGYSFIETFVYDSGKFYNLEPIQFKKLVESQGLKFKGSMVFKDFIGEDKKDVMNWWKQCIKDHKAAGVEYITTSNNEISKIKTLKDIKMFASYYNQIGKLCKSQGIKFGIHNHTKEFDKIEGIVFYDYLLENTKPEYVFFESDLYWMKEANKNPISYFKKYPNRFLSWHAKDNKELGESGETDFESIYKKANIAGLVYNIAEVEKYSYPVLISVEKAYQYLYYSDFVSLYEDN